MKIKMCGLKRKEDIEYANVCRPDYVGFVFANSKRQVSANEVASLCEHLNPTIKKVGVFVNESLDSIKEIIEESGIDVIQLHGDESKEYVEQLGKVTDKEVWKAVRIQSKEDVAIAITYPVDKLLFDSFSRDGYGGTGKKLDLTLLEDIDTSIPFFMAGGFTVDNIEEAIQEIKPYGIDISSGIETDGKKDLDKMKQVMKIIGGKHE